MRTLLRTYIIVTLFLFYSASLLAGEIKGHIYDKTSNEQAVGAYVVIKSLNKVSVTALDGSYAIKGLPPGSYTINVSYLGYEEFDTSIIIKNDNEIVTFNYYQIPASRQLKEVAVKAKGDGGTDAFALKTEKNADNVMNILSAKAIQISPDITVSEVMQRVSGVSVQTGNSGDGQYAVIRGMDKRYNTTLVNGVKIPSPDNRDRYVPLDMFPAELLERLEVIKSLTPSMEADATGGSMNMVMKNAPDRLLVEANFAAGYSDIFQNRGFQSYDASGVNWKSPSEILGPNVLAPVSAFPYSSLITTTKNAPVNTNASLSLGNRFFGNKLGVIVSGSYQNTYSGYNSNQFVENVVSSPSKDINTNNLPAFSDIDNRQYSTLSNRFGAMAKVDYRINDNNTLSVFATHIQLNQYRERSTIDSVPGGSTFNNEWTNVIGVKYRTETRTTLQNIDNVTLQGQHKIGNNFSADWSLVASEAKRLMPNDAQFGYDRKINLVTDSSTKVQSYTVSNPSYPYVTGMTDEWQHNTDKDMAGYLNLKYKVYAIPFLKSIEAGGLYRHKDRANYDDKYSLDQLLDKANPIYQPYTSIPDSKLTFLTTSGAYGDASVNPGVYTFSEDLLAYYAQARIEFSERFKILGGVRIENTQQSYNSSLPVTQFGQHASYSYTDILPSIQGKYDLSATGGIRFSYFNSLYRPAFADLIPFSDPSADEELPVRGNPYLQHSVIHNADVRYELFPKGLDQLMVGAFYKYIINPIEYAVAPETKTDLVLEPGNFGNATNYGAELVFRKFFGSFGISGNYTYTHSDINSQKSVFHYNTNGSGTTYDTVFQHRPLQGQAANIGNISLLYRNPKRKIEAQLAFVYTGERISRVSYYRDLDDWEKPTLNLDFSAQKKIGKHFEVYFKAKNLLNTGPELFIKQPNSAYNAPSKLPYQESANYYVIRKDYYYSSFLIGVRYKL